MAELDPFNILPQVQKQQLVQQTQARTAAATVPKTAPAPPANTGPTSKWARFAQVGTGLVNKVTFGAVNSVAKNIETKGVVKGLASSDIKATKGFASGLTSSERAVAKPIARLLPGGQNDLQAQNKSIDKNIAFGQQINQLHNAGKIDDSSYKQLLKLNQSNQNDTSKGVNALATQIKSDTNRGKIAAGVAGTALDILGAGEGLTKGESGLVSKIPEEAKLGKVADIAVNKLGAGAATGVANAKASGATGKGAIAQGLEGAAIPLAGSALGGVKSGLSGVKTALGKDKDVNSLITNAKTSALDKAGAKANTEDTVAKSLATPKTKLLSAGEKQPVKGEGFTMSDTADKTALSKGQQINQLQDKVTKFQQGKLNISPEEAKSNAQQLADLKSGKVAPTAAEKLTGKTSAAKVDESSVEQPIKKASVPTEKEMAPVTNQPKAKGLSGLVSTVSDKLHVSGKINPEQDLLNKGHTDAAQAVRELAANRDLAAYRGEKAEAQFNRVATKDEQNYDKFAADRESNTGTSAAHQHFTDTLQDTGKRSVSSGVLKSARDETYAPRLYKASDVSKSDAIGGLRKTGGFAKERVQAGEFGESGDKYATYAESKAAAEKAGLKAPNATTGQILGNTVANREKAIANAQGLDKLEKTTMADGKPAIVTVAPGKIPSKLAGYDTTILPGRAVHPDLAPAIKSFTQGSGKSNILTKLNSFTKRLVTVNGAVHDLNYARSSLGEQGLLKTIAGFHPTDIVQKGLDNPQYDADTERMIKNGLVSSRTGASNIFDEPNSSLNKKITGVLGGVRTKLDKTTFGIGDNLQRSTYLKLEKNLTGKLGPKEAGLQAADIANRVAMTVREDQQSAEAKSVGKAVLFAKNFFQSTIQKATTATGISKNNALSKAAQSAGQKQAVKALARNFGYLFAAAQGINYATTGHSTFSNKDSKISPVFYVDKNTGKEYHLTNWYGQVGELMHLTQPSALINKLSPGVQELTRIVSNKDQLPFSDSPQVRNTNASGVKQWGQIAANALEHFVTPAGIDSTKISQVVGKSGQPGKVTAANLFGFGTSTSDNNSMDKDILNQYYSSLPSSLPKQPPGQSNLEAAARNDLSKGNTNSSNVQQLKSQLSPASFRTFMKTGADNPTQRAFDSLPNTETKLNIIEKYSPQQLKELNFDGVAKSLVGTDAKSVITGLQKDGYSSQRISQDLQKVRIDGQQLTQIKAAAKKQASQTAAKSRKAPKFVNPLVR